LEYLLIFGIFYDHLVQFEHFSGFSTMYQEKSGNPGGGRAGVRWAEMRHARLLLRFPGFQFIFGEKSEAEVIKVKAARAHQLLQP
jgi:hypothetical protein